MYKFFVVDPICLLSLDLDNKFFFLTNSKYLEKCSYNLLCSLHLFVSPSANSYKLFVLQTVVADTLRISFFKHFLSIILFIDYSFIIFSSFIANYFQSFIYAYMFTCITVYLAFLFAVILQKRRDVCIKTNEKNIILIHCACPFVYVYI